MFLFRDGMHLNSLHGITSKSDWAAGQLSVAVSHATRTASIGQPPAWRLSALLNGPLPVNEFDILQMSGWTVVWNSMGVLSDDPTTTC